MVRNIKPVKITSSVPASISLKTLQPMIVSYAETRGSAQVSPLCE
jgi:hypothetical protein